MFTLKITLATAAAVIADLHTTSSSGGVLNWLFAATIIAGIATYVGLQVRDYRPNKRLREENAELRADCERKDATIDVLRKENEVLHKTRDFDAAFSVVTKLLADSRSEVSVEHRAILEALKVHGEGEMAAWGELKQQLGSLTSAVQVLAAGINSNS